MPASLLDSQLATLERPTPDENALAVSIAPPAESIAETVLKELGLARSEA